jgi:hypothetical protein
MVNFKVYFLKHNDIKFSEANCFRCYTVVISLPPHTSILVAAELNMHGPEHLKANMGLMQY